MISRGGRKEAQRSAEILEIRVQLTESILERTKYVQQECNQRSSQWIALKTNQYRQSLNERRQQQKSIFTFRNILHWYNEKNRPSSSKLPYGIHLRGEPHQFLLLPLPLPLPVLLLLLLCIEVTERTETYGRAKNRDRVRETETETLFFFLSVCVRGISWVDIQKYIDRYR